MSLIANSAQRDQAASTFGGSYAAAKSNTDDAAAAVINAQNEKQTIQSNISKVDSEITDVKNQLYIASDQDTIDSLTANLESLENLKADYETQLASIDDDISNLNGIFNTASEDEQKALMEMIASGQIPVQGLDSTKLINASGFNGVQPAFLNDAKNTVMGWLGDASSGDVNASLISSILQVPLSIPSLDTLTSSLAEGTTTRTAQALKDAALLQDLKAQTQNNIAQLEDDLLQSQLSGSNDEAAIQAKLDRQKAVLANINNSLLQGNVSTTNRNLISQCSDPNGLSTMGVLSGAASGLLKKKLSAQDSPFGVGVCGAADGDVDGNPVWWDATGPRQGVQSGVYDDIIVQHVEPKLKHAYMGKFPGKLGVLDWLIKSMDRPKIDVEYVEQMRNNVKRNYPIKYNFGDLSITLWDDVKHVTITTIESYFHGNVWTHPSKANRGEFLLRDSVVIPSFIIYDYVMETNTPLVYTFYNASLASFDFDSHDDLEDGGVHTIQIVLKIEGFSVAKGAPGSISIEPPGGGLSRGIPNLGGLGIGGGGGLGLSLPNLGNLGSGLTGGLTAGLAGGLNNLAGGSNAGLSGIANQALGAAGAGLNNLAGGLNSLTGGLAGNIGNLATIGNNVANLGSNLGSSLGNSVSSSLRGLF